MTTDDRDDPCETDEEYEQRLLDEDRESQQDYAEFESDPYTDEEKEQMDHD